MGLNQLDMKCIWFLLSIILWVRLKSYKSHMVHWMDDKSIYVQLQTAIAETMMNPEFLNRDTRTNSKKSTILYYNHTFLLSTEYWERHILNVSMNIFMIIVCIISTILYNTSKYKITSGNRQSQHKTLFLLSD